MPMLFQVTNPASYSQVESSGGTPPRRPPKCCFCLDVRIGTMALAIWQIALHVIALCAFLVVLFHPHLMQHYTLTMHSHHHDSEHVEAPHSMMAALDDNSMLKPAHVMPPAGPDTAVAAHTDFKPPAKLHFLLFGYKETWGSLDKDGNVQPKFTLTRMFLSRQPEQPAGPETPALVLHKDVPPQVEHDHASHSEPLAAAVKSSQPQQTLYMKCSMRHRYLVLAFVWLCLGLACLLLYGAKSRRPMHLLPYFCVQMLDYCITTIAIVGSVTKFAHLKTWLTYQHHIPFKNELMQLNRDVLALVLIILFLSVLVVKAYLMGMVWACYRYLLAEQRQQRSERRAGQEGQLDIEALPTNLEKPTLVVLPDYEKCLNLSEDFMPPAYSDEKADEATLIKKEDTPEAAATQQGV